MELKKKLSFVILIAILLFPIISAVTLQNQTTLFEGITSNSTILLEQNTTASSWDINESFGGIIITNLSTDNSIFKNTNTNNYNAKIGLNGLPDNWVVRSIQNNTLLFVSKGANYQYNVTFAPNTEIKVLNAINPTITINSPTPNEQQGTNTIQLSVTTNKLTSCNYSINNGAMNPLTTQNSLTFTKSLVLIYGDYNVNFTCGDVVSKTSKSVNFTMFQQGQGSSGSGSSSSGSSSSTQTYQIINLSSLKILTNNLCSDRKNQIRFTPLDENKQLVKINFAKLYINGIKKTDVTEFYKDKGYYQFNIGNQTKEENITISVNQLGKEINATITLNPKKCNGLNDFIKVKGNEFNNLIGEYPNLFIFVGLILFAIMVIGLFLGEAKKRRY